MNIQEEHNKRVTFNTMDGLEQNIHKLTVMMGKLVMKDNGQDRQFKLQVYQANRSIGHARCNYEQQGFQNRFRLDNNRNNTFRGRPRYGEDYQGRSRYDSNYRGKCRNNMRGNQRYGRQIIIEMDLGEISEIKAMTRVKVGHLIGNLEIITEGTVEALPTVDQGHVLQ